MQAPAQKPRKQKKTAKKKVIEESSASEASTDEESSGGLSGDVERVLAGRSAKDGEEDFRVKFKGRQRCCQRV